MFSLCTFVTVDNVSLCECIAPILHKPSTGFSSTVSASSLWWFPFTSDSPVDVHGLILVLWYSSNPQRRDSAIVQCRWDSVFFFVCLFFSQGHFSWVNVCCHGDYLGLDLHTEGQFAVLMPHYFHPNAILFLIWPGKQPFWTACCCGNRGSTIHTNYSTLNVKRDTTDHLLIQFILVIPPSRILADFRVVWPEYHSFRYHSKDNLHIFLPQLLAE